MDDELRAAPSLLDLLDHSRPDHRQHHFTGAVLRVVARWVLSAVAQRREVPRGSPVLGLTSKRG